MDKCQTITPTYLILTVFSSFVYYTKIKNDFLRKKFLINSRLWKRRFKIKAFLTNRAKPG